MSSQTQSLTEWAQSRFTTLFEHPAANKDTESQPSSSSSLESQIQALFSPTAQIYINHNGPVSVEEFNQQVGSTFGTNKTEVEWKDCLEVVDDKSKESDGGDNSPGADGKTGIFAGYLIVTRTLKFMIRAAPAKNYTYIWLSAKIAYDSEVSESSETGGQIDKRRIVQLFYTSVGKAAPLLLAMTYQRLRLHKPFMRQVLRTAQSPSSKLCLGSPRMPRAFKAVLAPTPRVGLITCIASSIKVNKEMVVPVGDLLCDQANTQGTRLVYCLGLKNGSNCR
ncbi:hypothetical protein BT96DRAFT_984254 [Gymnopus androsaceus JB14]|uniref:Uncharacterized protein n=1 Tax=Gymnopus androsaceus JB14 TaxID=1447944 RepID=A0A6A4IK12_9AGAR|nr:hypothetical protein BT96DRAFT_984254 [Gymnopus androsaceus JB14]